MKPLYKKNIDANNSYKLKNTIGKSFDGLWHFHEEFELIYIWEGRGKKVIGDNISNLNKGDLMLLGSELPHSFSCDQNFPAREKSGSLVIHLNKSFLTESFFTIPEFKRINKLITKSKSGVQFYGETERIAKRILTMYHKHTSNCILDILSILNQLSVHYDYKQLASCGYSKYLTKEGYERINKACKYVMNNFNEDICLDNVAKLVGLTKAAFCRNFKKATSKTFYSYVIEYRIGHACKLLMETNLNVTEVSYKSGFNTISNFNKQFKDIMNTNPSTYRKQFKKVQNIFTVQKSGKKAFK